MKHFYRNILCLLLILLAVAGIILMAWNIMDNQDNLNTISRSISNGTNGLNYLFEKKDVEIMTLTSNYKGSFYLRSDSWGEPSDSLCTGFKSGEKYTGKTTYNPLGYYTKKAQLSNAKEYTYTLEVKTGGFGQYLLKPDYSVVGIDNERSTDVACKPFQKTSSGTFYPKVDEEKINEVEFDETLKQEEEEYRKYVHQKYTLLPGDSSEREALKKRLVSFAKEKGFDLDSPTLVEDITVFFHKNYYYQEPSIPKNENYALYMLEKSDHGICNNFASASYYLYRALGIPTRIVCGYLVMNPVDRGDGTYFYSVKLKQCHAWNEVYIDGSGWKRVDNTSSRSDLDGEYDNTDQISSSMDSSIDSSNSSISSDISDSSSDDEDDIEYGSGVIAFKEEYVKTYDGTSKTMDIDDVFVLKNYKLNEKYESDYANDIDIMQNFENVKLSTFLENFGKGDIAHATFKYQDKVRTDVNYYPFICSNFYIWDMNYKDVTKRYGLTFEDYEERELSSYKKELLMNIQECPVFVSYQSVFNIDESQLPYTPLITVSMSGAPTGYMASISTESLTKEDFSFKDGEYSYTFTPDVVIADSSGKDCTANFEIQDMKDVKIILNVEEGL